MMMGGFVLDGFANFLKEKKNVCLQSIFFTLCLFLLNQFTNKTSFEIESWHQSNPAINVENITKRFERHYAL